VQPIVRTRKKVPMNSAMYLFIIKFDLTEANKANKEIESNL
jgi:hypothetical protein